MKKATVKFYVYSDIEQLVEYEGEKTDKELLDLAIETAVEEQPKVSWLFDENNEYEVTKEE